MNHKETGRVTTETTSVRLGFRWPHRLREALAGEKTAAAVDGMIGFLCFGVLVMYACFLGDLCATLFGTTRALAIVGVTVFPLLPLALLRDLSALAFSSILGIGAVLYLTAFSVLRALDGSCAPGGAYFAGLPIVPERAQISLARLSFGSFVLFNMLNTAFTAHTNAVRFYNELKDRSPARFGRVVGGAFALSTLVYGLAMSAGYATFGAASSGLILNNYHESADGLASFGRVATCVSVIGSHPLLFTSLRDAVLGALRPRFPVLAEGGAFAPWAALSVGLLAAATALAILTPDVGFVVSLSGALLCSLLVYSVPSYLNVQRIQKAGAATEATRRELAISKGLVGFGCVMAVAGTVVTFLETFTDLLE